MLMRILAIFLLLFSVLFLPFFISLILLIATLFLIPFFVEGVVIFSLFDLLYGLPMAKFGNMYFVTLLLALIFFISIQIFKTRLR